MEHEEIRTLMKENVKLHIIVIENESKKMVTKLQEEFKECTKSYFETN